MTTPKKIGMCSVHAVGMVLAATAAGQAQAQSVKTTADGAQSAARKSNDPDTKSDAQPADIVVTARRREERLQDVPDAITAISSTTIVNSGIAGVDDFARLVPNLTFRNGKAFSGGDIRMSMRGIGNGQQGWPSVSFMVDGVPVDSLDNLGGGNYGDLERIEILRGPQSAVYGANAIAGAINIVTRDPTDTLSGNITAEYASGSDKKLQASVSGPLIPGVLRFRVFAEGRDSDGLVKSGSNGRNLDFAKEFRTRNELMFTPGDRLSLTLQGEYNKTRTGSTYQEKIANRADIDRFDGDVDPHRRLIGEERRELYRFSLRGTYDFGDAKLVSVMAYSNSKQTADSSLCYDDPDNPQTDDSPAPGRQTTCLLGVTALGSAATAGGLVDEVFLGGDRSESFYHDTRLQSSGNGRFSWMFGGSYMSRRAENGFDLRWLLAGPAGGASCGKTIGYNPSGCGAAPLIFPLWNRRDDKWWGVYAQVGYDITDQLQLTLAGRYDNQRYRNTQFAERSFTTVVPVPDPGGVLVPMQKENKKSFQPKAQLSWKITPDVMTYLTYARGFRAGFFNTGAFTAPEKTDNYEAGLKTSFATDIGRLVVNAAAFHIDYSNQQFSTVITTPPFRVPVTIPRTKINGVELETSLQLRGGLSFSASGGFLDARISNGGGRSPLSPKFTSTLAADYDGQLGGGFGLIVHADWRHSSSLDLNAAAVRDSVGAKNYINLRAGISRSGITLTGFVENLTSEREPTIEGAAIGTAYIRYFNDPRRYGVQLRYNF
jgi:iron complex outermembrane receptor protein